MSSDLNCSYFLLIPPILLMERSTGFEPQSLIVCLSRPHSSERDDPPMPKLQIATARTRPLPGLDQSSPPEQREQPCGSDDRPTIFLF